MNRAEPRSQERLRYHFEVESRLADRLRTSERVERINGLYTKLYSELFENVVDHPQHRHKNVEQREEVAAQFRLLSRFLKPSSHYLELGAGDCALALDVAKHVQRSVAIDVADIRREVVENPEKFELVLTDGIHLPLPDGSIDIVYSNQLIEHIHPDDIDDQLTEIRRVLKEGGVFLCRTPNRVTGPHDISRYFGDTPVGFHLKEYRHGELEALLRKAGFTSVHVPWTRNGLVRSELPLAIFDVLDRLFEMLPRRLRHFFGNGPIAAKLFGICVVARV